MSMIVKSAVTGPDSSRVFNVTEVPCRR